jgi:alkanesulfonate monooxygenase SsuD/methylene tetrahydromethanopterin reductase-like flavin-dependent oxidoreductase (luciferase family)
MSDQTDAKPGIALLAMPGRRRDAVELAVEIERRGFPSIACPSQGDAIGFCLSVAHETETISFGTAILPIYLRRPDELAQAAAHVHEMSGGRFRLGLGISHEHLLDRLGLTSTTPLGDLREFVEALHAAEQPDDDGVGSLSRGSGPLPPVVLATLRDRMVDLAREIADGAIWANGTRAGIARALPRLHDETRPPFSVANMAFTVVDDDAAGARALNRSHLARYAALDNYRQYWKASGYEDEMTAVEVALADDPGADLAALISDRLLDDVALSGPASVVREGVAAWRDLGVDELVAVPSSTSGGQFRAIRELFAAFE